MVPAGEVKVSSFYLALWLVHIEPHSVTYGKVISCIFLPISCIVPLMDFIQSLWNVITDSSQGMADFSTNTGISFSSPSLEKGNLPNMISTGRDGDQPKLIRKGEYLVD